MSTSVLNNFGLNAYAAANRVGTMHLGRLGAVSEVSAEASIDVAVAVGETRVLMALVEELAKIDYATYQLRVTDVQAAVQAVSELNQQIRTLSENGVPAWRAALENTNNAMSALEQQLHADLAAARTRRDLWSVGLAAGAVLLAGVGGWYVFRHKKSAR